MEAMMWVIIPRNLCLRCNRHSSLRKELSMGKARGEDAAL
jgi:hypothetical protein